MKFYGINPNENNFQKTISEQNQNSPNYDNASIKTEYVNSEVPFFDITENKIFLYDNVLINKYYDKILSKCSVKTFAADKLLFYYNHPDRVSYDEYGTTDLFYLILYFNNFESIEDFVGFTYLKIPDITYVLSLLQNEEYINKKK